MYDMLQRLLTNRLGINFLCLELHAPLFLTVDERRSVLIVTSSSKMTTHRKTLLKTKKALRCQTDGYSAVMSPTNYRRRYSKASDILDAIVVHDRYDSMVANSELHKEICKQQQ